MTVALARDGRDLSGVVGRPTPRIETRRPRGRSRGGEAVRWAIDVLGLDLLDWQQYVLRRGLVQVGGRWSSRTVGTLVARQQGKTTLGTARALAGMVLFGEKRILAAAQNRDVALDAWNDALAVALDAGLDVGQVLRTTGREAFWIGDARYKVVSSTMRGARGLTADLVICDELREYRTWDGWAALEKTRRAKRSSQLWAMSTEGDEGSVVLARMAAAGRTNAALGSETDAAWFEWSAPPDVDRHDPRGWAAANPALGRLIDVDVIASESVHDEPGVFETEVLCRRVETLNPWMARELWEGTGDDRAQVPDGARVVFSLDAGPELRHATIGVGWARPDGRVHVEAVDSFSDVDGPVLARAGIRLAELVSSWSTITVVVAARTTAEAAALRTLPEGPVHSVSRVELARAQTSLLEAVAARSVVHPGDPTTGAHVAAVTATGVFDRRSQVADVDAAVAVALAHHGIRVIEDDQGPDWVAF